MTDRSWPLRPLRFLLPLALLAACGGDEQDSDDTPPQPVAIPRPAFPAIDRDLALLVPETLAAAGVEAVAREAAGPLLEEVRIFDVYTGTGVEEGMRSIAYRLRFRSPDRTLTDEEADAAVARVLERLDEELDVRRRA